MTRSRFALCRTVRIGLVVIQPYRIAWVQMALMMLRIFALVPRLRVIVLSHSSTCTAKPFYILGSMYSPQRGTIQFFK
jgi:hypothetical protein